VAGYSSPEPASGGLRRQIWGAFVALILAGVVFTLPDAAKEEFAAVLRNTALAPFIGLNSAILDTRARAIETEELRWVADSLTSELLGRRTLEEENRRLRDLLVLSERLGAGWLAAEALRPGTQGSESILLLDVGREDGIRESAPVVTREGLAGVVRERRGGQAVAMDWSHPEFAAGAMTQDGLTTGIVEVSRGAFRSEDRLTLKGTPFNTVLDSGTVIETSGAGGVFPRGIPIGRIERVESVQGRFQRNYEVTPFVDPGSITLVLVQLEGSEPQGPVGTAAGVAAVAGPEADSLTAGALDLSSAWPADERMTAGERARLLPVWQDSVRILRDSLDRVLGRTVPGSLGGGRR